MYGFSSTEVTTAPATSSARAKSFAVVLVQLQRGGAGLEPAGGLVEVTTGGELATVDLVQAAVKVAPASLANSASMPQ